MRSINALAKRLASAGFDSHGAPDFLKIRESVDLIAQYPERHRGLLLRKYAYFLEERYRQQTVFIEYAGSCDSRKIHQSLEELHQRPLGMVAQENKELVAGIRITLGDHIWERSIRSDLTALRS